MTGVAFVSIITTFVVTMMVIVVAKERASFEEKREAELLEIRRNKVLSPPLMHGHKFQNKDVIEVKDLLEEEVLAWLCPECHETVKPMYSIPRDPSTVKMLVGWQDA